ncbi:hypothetical protein [Galbibacter sp. BG1]|nr:hypothetical protein [Galbibacter sp. BG1]
MALEIFFSGRTELILGALSSIVLILALVLVALRIDKKRSKKTKS